MAEVFKKLGQGLLAIILSPFAVLALAIGLVVAIFIYFIMLIKAIVLFFKGDRIFAASALEIEAAEIIDNRMRKAQEDAANPQPSQSLYINQAAFYPHPQQPTELNPAPTANQQITNVQFQPLPEIDNQGNAIVDSPLLPQEPLVVEATATSQDDVELTDMTLMPPVEEPLDDQEEEIDLDSLPRESEKL